MNILCISKYGAAPAKYNKISSRLFYLMEEFAKYNHKVNVITSDANHLASYPKTNKTYNFENINDVDLCWIKTKKYKKTTSIKRIFSWFDFEWKLFGFKIKEDNIPDVIVVSSLSIFSIIYGFFLKRRYNSKLIFEIRDIWPLTMTEEIGLSKFNPLVIFVAWVEKFGYRKADLVVGTMPKLNEHVKLMLGYEKPFFCSPLGFHSELYKKIKWSAMKVVLSMLYQAIRL